MMNFSCITGVRVHGFGILSQRAAKKANHSSPSAFFKKYFSTMQTIKPSVVKHSAIEVIVPQPWRKIGKFANIILAINFFGYSWRLFFYPEPASGDMLFAAWVGVITAPILFCFTLPVFLNKYPAWLVRLVGEKFLNNLIADCKKRLGENRTNKAHLHMPHGWFDDKKVFWIVVIVGAFILGILSSFGLL